MIVYNDKSNLINQHEFFREMPASTRATLAARARVLTFGEGDRIFAKGDDGFGLLAVMSGTVRISVSSDGATVLKVVSTRLRRTSQQLEQASFGPMSSRLAQAILSIGRAGAPTGVPQGPIKMSQRQIGNLIGLSRESTNRYLRAWQRAGVIDLGPGAVSIRDWKTLERFAAEDA